MGISDFIKRLHVAFGVLTQTDLHSFLLLREGFHRKELSHILVITEEGVKKARQRLRKRIGLKEDDSLNAAIEVF